MSELAEEIPVDDEDSNSVIKENLTTEPDEDEQDDQNSEENSDENPEDESEQEVIITLGEEAPPADEEDQAHDPVLVKKLRKEVRHRDREIKRLSHELEEKKTPKEAKPEAMQEPTLDACDYDEKKYRDQLFVWKEQIDLEKAQSEKIKQQEQSANQSFQERVSAYNEAKAKLKGVDFEEAEAIVNEVFSKTQIGIILDCAKSPEKVIAALGKHPLKAKELAAISSPARYAAAIGALETELKVIPKKSPPPPEVVVGKGSAKMSGAVDSNVERLRNKAIEQSRKTGVYDATEIHRYNMSKRKK